jgi:hypothetical protein
MNYIIGSVAASNLFLDFKRKPFDLDILIQSKEEKFATFNDKQKIEFHFIPPLYDYIENNGKIVTGNILLTLKSSHIFWDIKWDKTMFDIVFFFEHGCKIIPELFHELYEHWNKEHGRNHRSKLDISAEKFFDNALKEYDHDYLHTLINPSPTYFKILKDNAEVEVSEEKFNFLSHEEKLSLVREEIYVMAFERRGDKSYRRAYGWMLKKFIMYHAPLWEVLFILENYRDLQQPQFNYIQKLENELSRN